MLTCTLSHRGGYCLESQLNWPGEGLVTKAIPDSSHREPDTTKRPCPGVKTGDLGCELHKRRALWTPVRGTVVKSPWLDV